MRGFVLSIFFLCGYIGAFFVAAAMAIIIHDHPTDAIVESGTTFYLVGIVYGALWIWYLTYRRKEKR